jgi:polysaccharide export outer membrane protein
MSSCGPKRDLVYFSNMVNSTTTINDTQSHNVRIRQNDIINVTLNSLNPESNSLFSGNKSASSDKNGYKVSKNGTIQLPLIGEFKIEGMSVEQAELAITSELKQHVKGPVVDVQIVNFKVSVLGEVSRPATFIVTSDNINLLEALSMAGDMTVYGKRENVLIIRTEVGNKTMKRLNLNDEETINSPYFYLKQNDIVYVEPDKSKAVEYSTNTRVFLPLLIASISALAVVAAVFLGHY